MPGAHCDRCGQDLGPEWAALKLTAGSFDQQVAAATLCRGCTAELAAWLRGEAPADVAGSPADTRGMVRG